MASWRESKLLITITVVYAVFVDLFLYSFVITILPPILEQRANVPTEDIQFWVSTNIVAYNVANIVTCPLFGWVADRFQSRKVPLLVGLVALAASTMFLALGETLAIITIARMLQAASASMVWAVGLALLVDSMGVDGKDASMGWVVTSASVAVASGPFVGGVLYENLGHLPAFSIAAGLVLTDIVLRLMIVDPQRHPDAENSPSSDSSETEPLIRASNTGASTEMATKQKNAWMVMATDKGFVRASFLVLVAASVHQAVETILAPYVETTFGWSTQDAGLIYLFLMVPFLAGPLVDYVSRKIRSDTISAFGFTLVAICTCLLSLIVDSQTKTIAAMAVLLFGVGIGMTSILTTQVASITLFGKKKEKETPGSFGPGGATAQCCSMYNVVYSSAGMLGPAVAGGLQTSFGWEVSTISLGCFASLGLAFCLFPLYRDHASGKRSVAS